MDMMGKKEFLEVRRRVGEQMANVLSVGGRKEVFAIGVAYAEALAKTAAMSMSEKDFNEFVANLAVQMVNTGKEVRRLTRKRRSDPE